MTKTDIWLKITVAHQDALSAADVENVIDDILDTGTIQDAINDNDQEELQVTDAYCGQSPYNMTGETLAKEFSDFWTKTEAAIPDKPRAKLQKLLVKHEIIKDSDQG